MIGSINSNIAALTAYGIKMRVTSDNIANVYTDGYKKSRATIDSGPDGQVAVHVNRIDTPGFILPFTDGERLAMRELSNVDLAEEIPEMILTRNAYQANLRAIAAQDEMLGTLLDVLA